MIEDSIAENIGFKPQQTEFLTTARFLPKRKPKKETGLVESTKAAFSLENPIGSQIKFGKIEETPLGVVTQAVRGELDQDFDKDFNPFDKEQYNLKGYEEYSRYFTPAQNVEEADNTKDIIDQQRELRGILERDGLRGFALMMAAGILSPENLIPGAAYARTVKVGESILAGTKSAAKAGFIATSISEGSLQQSQATRTPEESAIIITGGTVLSGLIGGLAGKFSAAKMQRLSDQIEKDIVAAPYDTSVGAMKAGLSGPELQTQSIFGLREKKVLRLKEKAKDLKGDELAKVNAKIAKLESKVDLFDVFSFGPGARMENNPLDSAKLLGRDLESNPTRIVGNIEGKASPKSVEDAVKIWDGNLSTAIQKTDDVFFQFRTGKENTGFIKRRISVVTDLVRKDIVTRSDYSQEIGKAMSNGDKAPHLSGTYRDAVEKGARVWRKEFYDPIAKAAEESGLLPKDFEFDSITAASYINRVYNTRKIVAQRDVFEDRIVKWLETGGSREAEISRLVKKAKNLKGKELDSIRTKIEKLEKKGDLKLKDRGELLSIARDVTDTIVRTPGGAISQGKLLGKAGSLHRRSFLMPDKYLEDFLERDIDVLGQRIRRNVVPQIELARKFGSIDMKAQIDNLVNEADIRVRSVKPQKEKNRLIRARDAGIRDAKAMRDRLLGVYKAPDNPEGIVHRASWLGRQFNFLSHMGQMTVSSVPDIGKPVFVEGLPRVSKALLNLAMSPKVFKLKMNELRGFGVGTDMVLHTRSYSLYEIGDPYGNLTKFERGVKAASDNFGMATLMDPWNATMKQVSGVVVEDRILTTSVQWAKGTISGEDIQKLAAAGIDEPMAVRIAQEFSGNKESPGKGEIVDGIKFARYDKWEDKNLAREVQSSVIRDVDNIIVSRGVGDTPLMASTELGKHIFQFKNFAISTVRRTLQTGLQQRDMAVLNGTMIMLAVGAMTYANKAMLAGREISTDPGTVMLEAVDHSGLFGFLWEAPQMLDRSLGGTLLGSGLSRYRTRPRLGALLGPSFGTGERIFSIGIAAAKGEADEATAHAARRLTPYNNLFYLRFLFDQLEGRE